MILTVLMISSLKGKNDDKTTSENLSKTPTEI